MSHELVDSQHELVICGPPFGHLAVNVRVAGSTPTMYAAFISVNVLSYDVASCSLGVEFVPCAEGTPWRDFKLWGIRADVFDYDYTIDPDDKSEANYGSLAESAKRRRSMSG